MLTPFVLTLTAASSVPVLVAPALFRALLELRYPAAPPDRVGAPDLPAGTHGGRLRRDKARPSQPGKRATIAPRPVLHTRRDRQHPVRRRRPRDADMPATQRRQ